MYVCVLFVYAHRHSCLIAGAHKKSQFATHKKFKKALCIFSGSHHNAFFYSTKQHSENSQVCATLKAQRESLHSL